MIANAKISIRMRKSRVVQIIAIMPTGNINSPTMTLKIFRDLVKRLSKRPASKRGMLTAVIAIPRIRILSMKTRGILMNTIMRINIH